jgi:hypothetical protein
MKEIQLDALYFTCFRAVLMKRVSWKWPRLRLCQNTAWNYSTKGKQSILRHLYILNGIIKVIEMIVTLERSSSVILS